MSHPDNALFHALNNVQRSADENRRIIREMRAEAKLRHAENAAGEDDYDGDGGREQADHMRDNGQR